MQGNSTELFGPTEYKCNTCGGLFTRDRFHTFYCKKNRRNYRRKFCKTCSTKKSTAWRRLPIGQARTRSYQLKCKFGITPEQFEAMKQSQNGLCAICNKPESKLHRMTKKTLPLHIDHCHITGRIRALLCSRCNLSIGMFDDNIEWLEASLAYLKKHAQSSG